MNDLGRIHRIIAEESSAVANIPVRKGHEYANALELINYNIHQHDPGKIVVSGMGKAGEIGKNIATTFCSTGTPAVFLDPAAAQHGDIGVIQQFDVLLLISNSGETKEVLELIRLSDALWNRLPIIAITGNPDSPLAGEADALLLTGNPDEVCPLGMSPTTSTTVMTVIGDILITMTMERIGFTREDYAKRHHGGYLGEKARG
jgi:arabinose-5-phosphate isomerase